MEVPRCHLGKPQGTTGDFFNLEINGGGKDGWHSENSVGKGVLKRKKYVESS